MAINDLNDLFVRQLEEMYAVEQRLVDVLGDLERDANNEKLRDGFADHQDETRRHVERVEEAFRALGREPQSRESKVLEALVEEREELVADATDDQLHDLIDIQAGMKTERIEITGYQGLLVLANKLNLDDDVTDPLQDNLSSEKSALRELEGLSKGSKLKSMLGQLTG